LSDEEPELMKTCRGCGGQVPESRLAPCPLCGKSKGFSYGRGILEPHIPVGDTVRWKGEITETTIIETNYPKRRIIALIIMVASVTLAGIFKLEYEGYTPFVMLATFFLTSIPFFWKDFMKQKQRVHKSSEN
jgi:hypothetical protein